MLAKNDDELDLIILKLLMGGFVAPGGRLELSAVEQPTARAVLLYMFHLAKASTSEKAPRTLPPNFWSEAVNRYNAAEVVGVRREFSVKRLLGADSILTDKGDTAIGNAKPQNIHDGWMCD